MADLIDALSRTTAPLSKFANWWTLEIRVVMSVRKSMSKRGVALNSKALRLVMYSSGFADRLANPRGDDPAKLNAELGGTLMGRHRDLSEEADQLRKLLVVAFRRRLPGSTPSSEFNESLEDARTATIIQHVDDRSDDDGLFDHRVKGLHPLREQDFRELRAEWPRASRVLGALTTSPDRLALLRRWATNSAGLLESAPPETWALLADLAADLGEGDLAGRLIERALAEGVAPKAYWTMRLMNVRQISDIEIATEFLSEVRGDPLVEATLHLDGIEEAITLLEEWSPPTRREDVHRRLILAQMYLGNLRTDEAIAIAVETFEDFQSTGAALIAARALTTRNMVDSTLAHRNDLSDALALTVKARTMRREWGIDAGEALALELRVRRMLSDYQGALDIANGAGGLPATSSELRYPEVIVEVAKLHAESGDIEIAKRLLGEAPENRKAHIAAIIAQREGRSAEASAKWTEAIDATDDLGEKANLALQLALHGHRDGFIDLLKEGNPEIARELEMIAALFNHESGALERFRGLANEKYRGALFLFIYLKGEGLTDEAGRVAREGAQKWSDPDLWIESAKYLYNTGRPKDAITDIHAALAAAPSNWGGRRAAYRQLVEAFSHSDDWREARNAAAQLLAEEPDNPSAVWALVYCHLRLNDLPSALQTWLAGGSLEPDSELQVGAWIELLGAFGAEVGSSQDALRIAARYPNDEQIRRGLISVLFLGPKKASDGSDESDTVDEVDADEGDTEPNPDREAFRELLAGYQRDFPSTPFFKEVPVDEDDPIASMQAAFEDAPDNSELEKQIESGALPLGFAAELFGRSYLEVLIASDSGPVFAGTGDIAADQAAIETGAERGVVLDLSALVTLARLPEEVRPRLEGQFSIARVVVEHQRDAIAGNRIIHRDSGLSFHPGKSGRPGYLNKRTPEELADRSALGDSVEASFSRFTSVSHPTVAAMPQRLELDFNKPFLLAIDLAREVESPLWADDHALRELLKSEGGLAFGTPELLQKMRVDGLLETELLDLSEATLISRGYSGFRFRPAVWDLAVSIGPSPIGIINSIRFAGGDEAIERARFALQLADRHVSEPSLLAGIVRATAQWLVGIAGAEETASQNIVILVRQLLHRTWMNSSTLPYCVSALRDIPGPVDAHSVLLREIYRWFETLAVRIDDRAAATTVFELVSRLDPSDGLRVRGAIIARRFE